MSRKGYLVPRRERGMSGTMELPLLLRMGGRSGGVLRECHAMVSLRMTLHALESRIIWTRGQQCGRIG